MADFDCYKIIDKYYPADALVRGILIRHSESVAHMALEIASANGLPLDPDEIRNAAMLHDIGIIFTDAPGIECHGTEPYLRHGVIGADLLRREGAPEKYARVAERHTGAGLTREDIVNMNLPLPEDRTYMPGTTLEKLICYADCFYSKNGDMQKKSLERVRTGMARHGEAILDRFNALHKEFS